MVATVASARPALELVRARVMADPALQRRLASCLDAGSFSDRLRAAAQDWDVQLHAEDLAAALRPDPLDTSQYMPRPADGMRWPAGPWLPVDANAAFSDAAVDWLYFGDRQLSEPFFYESLRQVQRLPFNRLFRYRIGWDTFLSGVEDSARPDGLIFHMSRCGSTLAARMIAALPDSLVVSEPPPLDQVLQLCRGASEDLAIQALRAMVAALGRRRRGETRYVLKLDAWHVLALPLFRRAFPNVPWVFLYRDPLEVLVSQVRQRGMQMVPEFVSPSLFGVEAGIPDEDYCARVLVSMCRGALDHFGLGGGLLVNYAQLPDAVDRIILPHFDIGVGDGERAAMRQAARRDAKQPQQDFTPDSAEKHREAGDALRALVRRHLADVYQSLEGLRLR